jgi:hypothetical protein
VRPSIWRTHIAEVASCGSAFMQVAIALPDARQ